MICRRDEEWGEGLGESVGGGGEGGRGEGGGMRSNGLVMRCEV